MKPEQKRTEFLKPEKGCYLHPVRPTTVAHGALWYAESLDADRIEVDFRTRRRHNARVKNGTQSRPQNG